MAALSSACWWDARRKEGDRESDALQIWRDTHGSNGGFYGWNRLRVPDSTKSVCYIQSTDFIVCFYYASQTSKRTAFQFKQNVFRIFYKTVLTLLYVKIINWWAEMLIALIFKKIKSVFTKLNYQLQKIKTKLFLKNIFKTSITFQISFVNSW